MADEQADEQVSTGEMGDLHAMTSGGGTAGVPVVHAFPFTHATPGISDPTPGTGGAALYTPTIGDLLLDVWCEITEAFDGTTPRGNFGTMIGTGGGDGTGGWLFLSEGMDMTDADFDIHTADGLFCGFENSSLLATSITGQVEQSLQVNGSGPALGFAAARGQRLVPARFTLAHPIKMLITTTGLTDSAIPGNGGQDPGCTVGSGVLYVMTVTPITA